MKKEVKVEKIEFKHFCDTCEKEFHIFHTINYLDQNEYCHDCFSKIEKEKQANCKHDFSYFFFSWSIEKKCEKCDKESLLYITKNLAQEIWDFVEKENKNEKRN